MRKTILRSIFFTVLFILGMMLFIMTLNTINAGFSHYMPAFHNEIVVGDMKNQFYTVENVQSDNNVKTLTIKSDKQQPLSVFLDNLEFMHEIYINGKRVSQNKNETAAHYESEYAYKLFEIDESQYDSGKTVIQIRGSEASKVSQYIAGSEQMEKAVQIRIICYAMMLMCLMTVVITCLVIFFHQRDAKYYLIFSVSAAVSIIKSINLGELSALAGAFGLTADHYVLINKITTNINILLPALVMLYLMHIPVSGQLKATMSLCFLLLMASAVINSLSILYVFLNFVIIVFNIGLSIYGCVKEKPFSPVIFLNNTLFLSFAFYGFDALNQGLKGGVLDFYIHLPYLGSIICLFVFLMVFVKSHFIETKALEAQKKEYERVTLLRGIGHDLKLPLSVIKTSNQMAEKYDLNEKKRKEYAEMSLEAASELEKMTNNISSFLYLDHSAEDDAASIRKSFDKTKRHYSAYSLVTGQVFTAHWEGADTQLSIRPLQLERMLFNLLDNAFKYNKIDGEVHFSCSIQNKKAVIRVSDTGMGMDKEQIDQIFTPFYRGQASRTKNGLGLGLSIVKGIADNLKGSIKVDSEKGVGTTFTIILPIS